MCCGFCPSTYILLKDTRPREDKARLGLSEDSTDEITKLGHSTEGEMDSGKDWLVTRGL